MNLKMTVIVFSKLKIIRKTSLQLQRKEIKVFVENHKKISVTRKRINKTKHNCEIFEQRGRTRVQVFSISVFLLKKVIKKYIIII